MGRLSWIIQIYPSCNLKCPSKREAGGDLTHKKEGHIRQAELEREAAMLPDLKLEEGVMSKEYNSRHWKR